MGCWPDDATVPLYASACVVPPPYGHPGNTGYDAGDYSTKSMEHYNSLACCGLERNHSQPVVYTIVYIFLLVTSGCAIVLGFTVCKNNPLFG